MLRVISDSVNVVHYKAAPDLLQEMYEQKTVQQNDDDHINNDWREKVEIFDRYEKYLPKFLNILEQFKEM